MEKIWLCIVCGLLKGITSINIENTNIWSFFAYSYDANLELPDDYEIRNSICDEGLYSYTLTGSNTRYDYLTNVTWDGLMTYDKYNMIEPYETLIQDSIMKIGYNPSDTTFCIIRNYKDLNICYIAFRVRPESVPYFIETLRRAYITQRTQTNITDRVSVSKKDDYNNGCIKIHTPFSETYNTSKTRDDLIKYQEEAKTITIPAKSR